MDYEKKYNEALERARKIHSEIVNNEIIGFPGQIEDIFPELRESESDDERIRKGLIKLLTVASEAYLVESTGIKKDSYLSYLEKQKEQKPAEWNDADMREARNNLISVCRDWERGEKTTLIPLGAVRARYFLEHLEEGFKTCRESGLRNGQKYVLDNAESYGLCKPAEWSEEDEKMLDSVIRIITHVDDLAHEPTFAGPKWTHPYSKEIRFLNKLRNRFRRQGSRDCLQKRELI